MSHQVTHTQYLMVDGILGRMGGLMLTQNYRIRGKQINSYVNSHQVGAGSEGGRGEGRKEEREKRWGREE